MTINPVDPKRAFHGHDAIPAPKPRGFYHIYVYSDLSDNFVPAYIDVNGKKAVDKYEKHLDAMLRIDYLRERNVHAISMYKGARR